MHNEIDPDSNFERTRRQVDYVPRAEADVSVYADLGFRCGLEIHQQLDTTQKLFCRCPAGIYQNGDNYDRYRLRIDEMRQSLRIVDQALDSLPSGKIRADAPHFLHPPVGEVFCRIEAPKGELGFYIVSDNSIAPYRLHIRSPIFLNLATLPNLARGWKLADAILTAGTYDVCMGEVDR